VSPSASTAYRRYGLGIFDRALFDLFGVIILYPAISCVTAGSTNEKLLRDRLGKLMY
jgi:hypothetical protein